MPILPLRAIVRNILPSPPYPDPSSNPFHRTSTHPTQTLKKGRFALDLSLQNSTLLSRPREKPVLPRDSGAGHVRGQEEGDGGQGQENFHEDAADAVQEQPAWCDAGFSVRRE